MVGTGSRHGPLLHERVGYAGVARECVVIGPGSIDQAHGVEEWVEIAELEKLSGIYRRWWGLEE